MIGAIAVLAIALLVVPMPLRHVNVGRVELVNALVAAGYVAIAVPLGVALGTRGMLRLANWLREERPATITEIRLLLSAPSAAVRAAGGPVVSRRADVRGARFHYSGRLGVRVAIVVAITGVVTAACAYLLTERSCAPRPRARWPTARRTRITVPGVVTRAVFAWALGTGLPMVGVVAIGILALTGDPATTRRRSA